MTLPPTAQSVIIEALLNKKRQLSKERQALMRLVAAVAVICVSIRSFLIQGVAVQTTSQLQKEFHTVERDRIFNDPDAFEHSTGDGAVLPKPTPTRLLTDPVFVVGYPKSGTTSVWRYFNCSGIVTQHYCAKGELSDHPPCKHGTMANCILKNMAAGKRMLDKCGDYQVYSQIDGERPQEKNSNKTAGVVMDDGSIETHNKMRHFLPQHFLLDRLHKEHPDATYILPLRDPKDWAQSAIKWFKMRIHFYNEYIYWNSSIARPSADEAVDWLANIYEEHTAFVRDFVKKHPSHTLVEVNIYDPNAGKVMEDAFGLPGTCWGHHNKFGNRKDSEFSKQVLK